jgi:hypothetical protein
MGEDFAKTRTASVPAADAEATGDRNGREAGAKIGAVGRPRVWAREVSSAGEYEKEAAEMAPRSIFSSPGWIECFKAPGRVPIYLRFVSGNDTVGVIGGLRIEPPNRLVRKIYRPVLFFSGPSLVHTDKALFTQCMHALSEFACRDGYSRLSFHCWDYPLRFDATGLSIKPNIRKELIIDLRGSLADIFGKVRRYVKQNARRALENGATFHESDSGGSVSDLISLLGETKKRRLERGHADYAHYYMPFLEDRIVYEMVRRGIARVFRVLKNGEALSAELVLTHANRAYALLNATGAQGYRIGANHFLQLSLIEKLKRDGLEHFNLGGIPGNGSGAALAFFKTSCGAQENECMGGTTKFLNGFISHFNPVLDAYEKLDREQIKRVLGTRVAEKIKHAKTELHW